ALRTAGTYFHDGMALEAVHFHEEIKHTFELSRAVLAALLPGQSGVLLPADGPKHRYSLTREPNTEALKIHPGARFLLPNGALITAGEARTIDLREAVGKQDVWLHVAHEPGRSTGDPPRPERFAGTIRFLAAGNMPQDPDWWVRLYDAGTRFPAT